MSSSYTPVLKKLFQEQVIPQLQKSRGYKNTHQIPKISKVVLNTGIDADADKNQISDTARDLGMIAGQKPVIVRCTGGKLDLQPAVRAQGGLRDRKILRAHPSRNNRSQGEQGGDTTGQPMRTRQTHHLFLRERRNGVAKKFTPYFQSNPNEASSRRRPASFGARFRAVSSRARASSPRPRATRWRASRTTPERSSGRFSRRAS